MLDIIKLSACALNKIVGGLCNNQYANRKELHRTQSEHDVKVLLA